MRFVEAIEGEAFDLPPLMFHLLDLGVIQGRRVLMICGRLREPTFLVEQGICLRSLALDAHRHVTDGDGPAREDETAHHQLVHGGPGGEIGPRIGRRDAGRTPVLSHRQVARRHKARRGTKPEYEGGHRSHEKDHG
jgi:hypothetical protein